MTLASPRMRTSAEMARDGSSALAVTAATGRCAGPDRLVHDAPDGGEAAAALRAAAEAAVDLTGRARACVRHGGAHLGVGEHVTGADDHRKARWRPRGTGPEIRPAAAASKWKTASLQLFQSGDRSARGPRIRRP